MLSEPDNSEKVIHPILQVTKYMYIIMVYYI